MASLCRWDCRQLHRPALESLALLVLRHPALPLLALQRDASVGNSALASAAALVATKGIGIALVATKGNSASASAAVLAVGKGEISLCLPPRAQRIC